MRNERSEAMNEDLNVGGPSKPRHIVMSEREYQSIQKELKTLRGKLIKAIAWARTRQYDQVKNLLEMLER